jgi:hypothetical protein
LNPEIQSDSDDWSKYIGTHVYEGSGKERNIKILVVQTRKVVRSFAGKLAMAAIGTAATIGLGSLGGDLLEGTVCVRRSHNQQSLRFRFTGAVSSISLPSSGMEMVQEQVKEKLTEQLTEQVNSGVETKVRNAMLRLGSSARKSKSQPLYRRSTR